jgi:hypothetical protein
MISAASVSPRLGASASEELQQGHLLELAVCVAAAAVAYLEMVVEALETLIDAKEVAEGVVVAAVAILARLLPA